MLPLVRSCNDGDVGYTCVDARLNGLMATGSISFQDATIISNALLCLKLVTASKSTLTITVKQSQSATSKVIAIAGVDFNSVGNSSDAEAPFTEYTAAFDIANDIDTQLTLTGTNKIITIEDAS